MSCHPHKLIYIQTNLFFYLIKKSSQLISFSFSFLQTGPIHFFMSLEEIKAQELKKQH